MHGLAFNTKAPHNKLFESDAHNNNKKVFIMKPASILIVDDEPLNYDVMEIILEDEDYILHYAPNGLKAIDSLPSISPDIILMDVMMPGISGIETCQRIKSMPEWREIPIVMVTSLSSKEDLGRCIDAGAEDFLSKPVNPIELRARVHAMLRIKRQYDNIKSLNHFQANTIRALQNNLDTLRVNLVSSLPHELNTPLNGIYGVLDLLLYPGKSMDEAEIRQLLELAKESMLRLGQSIQRFLMYFELEMLTNNSSSSSVISVEKSCFKARPLIESCASKQLTKFNRLNDLKIQSDNAEIVGNSDDLCFIVEELLENACKFSEPGTPISLICRQVDEGIQLSISDQGRGMTPEQISTIGAFIQFERKKYEQQGSGLGLAIIRKMIDIWGGSLSIESFYNQGTNIQLFLPSQTI